jgi:glutamate dehydrogenase
LTDALDRDQALKRERIAEIAEAGRRLRLRTRLPVNRSRFLEHYYAQAPREDLAGDERMLAAAALDHLCWALVRQPGTARVRVFNPNPDENGWSSPRTVVQMANDDMPFLVDSITMRLGALGHGIHVTFHPILHVLRDGRGRLQQLNPRAAAGSRRESLIHIEFQRETDAAVLQGIVTALEETLADVRAAVEDWPAMIEQLRAASRDLGRSRGVPEEARAEACEFLDWLADDRFTLLGYREQRIVRGRNTDRLVPKPATGLGILRDGKQPGETVRLAGEARREARSPTPLVVTKIAVRSTVHRPARLDYIGVKVFGRDGRPRAEKRFLGLFTSDAYHQRPRNIPLLRRKVRQVVEQSGFDPASHRCKRLQHVLNTFPRDDLFQITVEDLTRISFGVLALQERHRVRLFWRRDAFGRFYSCLLYLPRDQYTAQARQRVESILQRAFSGTEVETDVAVSESTLARLAITVRADETAAAAEPDTEKLQAEIENAVRSWSDCVREALLTRVGEDQALGLLHRFADGFSAAYQEEAGPARAAADIETIADLLDTGAALRMHLIPVAGQESPRLRFTTFHRDSPIPLYTALPVLEHMGMRVLSEHIYAARSAGTEVWIQDFELEPAGMLRIDGAACARFMECFRRVLIGDADNDRFNSFVVSASLEWREAALLRAYCRYILQTGLPFSQAYMQEVLGRYPSFCRALVDGFHGRFNPDLGAARRRRRLNDSRRRLEAELDAVVSLDEDRILRAFLAVIDATLRTNYFQVTSAGPKAYLSFKLDSPRIAELPKPWPMCEIFVYSQRVEAVHLRSGPIARGGIRWSDRREDFRTEVLGLMKAQHVKNVVIVPAGAKGGFVCKRLPSGDRDAVQREVTACYQTFIRGLLDLTDNVVDGRAVRPERVIARDRDDSYLVVAADRGTAALSDVANAIAAEYGFWLGDAFASGGSAGYDHKEMGITARGVWEAVKRHFRELGVDVANERVTVTGIGDMSGDVFGNGMLLSPHLRLVAAFNHQHIFIDPAPDTEQSFQERQRLAALPRSSWDDYDRSRLSAGGGVYERASKSIELSAAAQALLGISAERLTPPELIKAILRAPVDLHFNGGIGTYVKASRESHADAGDPANDAVRVNGNELRCRVVAEGGNLGFTQLARIEYALAGGRINTDFIDNSGGVDSSDREVNIKILLNGAVAAGRLTLRRRNSLLAAMTDELATLVLANNYAQTQALSIIEAHARERIGEHARVIRVLESTGLLDRSIEHLPSEEQIEERRKAGHALTRPELAIVLSYAKIQLTASLAASEIPDDAYLARELLAYFPRPLGKDHTRAIGTHPLRREIIAMLISSSMINRMGPFFVLRVQDETGANVAQIARAYAIAREIFDVRTLWREIESLDGHIPSGLQYDTSFQVRRMVQRCVHWLLRRHREALTIEPLIDRLKAGAIALLGDLPAVTGGRTRRQLERDRDSLANIGLPPLLAERVAALALMNELLDVIEVSRELSLDLKETAELHFELARGLKLDWLREQIEALKVDGRWRATARGALRESLAQAQRALLTSILAARGRSSPRAALASWLAGRKERIVRLRRMLDEMKGTGEVDFAALSVALKELDQLR